MHRDNMNVMKSDAKLLQEILKGNEKSFDDLFLRHRPYLLRTAVSILRDVHESEDIVQEVFMKLISKEIVSNKESMLPYLKRMTTNACLMRLRKKKETLLEDPSSIAQAYDEVGDEHEQVIQEALNALEDQYRVPLVLRYYENYKFDAIAKSLKTPVSTVQSRMNKGLKMIANRLKKSGFAVLVPLLPAKLKAMGRRPFIPREVGKTTRTKKGHKASQVDTISRFTLVKLAAIACVVGLIGLALFTIFNENEAEPLANNGDGDVATIPVVDNDTPGPVVTNAAEIVEEDKAVPKNPVDLGTIMRLKQGPQIFKQVLKQHINMKTEKRDPYYHEFEGIFTWAIGLKKGIEVDWEKPFSNKPLSLDVRLVNVQYNSKRLRKKEIFSNEFNLQDLDHKPLISNFNLDSNLHLKDLNSRMHSIRGQADRLNKADKTRSGKMFYLATKHLPFLTLRDVKSDAPMEFFVGGAGLTDDFVTLNLTFDKAGGIDEVGFKSGMGISKDRKRVDRWMHYAFAENGEQDFFGYDLKTTKDGQFESSRFTYAISYTGEFDKMGKTTLEQEFEQRWSWESKAESTVFDKPKPDPGIEEARKWLTGEKKSGASQPHHSFIIQKLTPEVAGYLKALHKNDDQTFELTFMDRYLTAEKMDKQQDINDSLKLISPEMGVTGIKAPFHTINKGTVNHLSSLVELKTLKIKIDEFDLDIGQHFSLMNNLWELVVVAKKSSTGAVNQLSGLSSLRRLSLFVDIGMDDLAKLEGMQFNFLFLQSRKFDNRIVDVVSGSKGLRDLSLKGSTVDVDRLNVALGKLAISRLYIENDVTDSELKALSENKALNMLGIGGKNLTYEGLRVFSKSRKYSSYVYLTPSVITLEQMAALWEQDKCRLGGEIMPHANGNSARQYTPK